jgi:hypothetical protein
MRMKRIFSIIVIMVISGVLSAAVGPNESLMTIAMPKNTAGKLYVYAHDNDDGTAKTGDAANIDAFVSLDGAAEAAIADTAPSEIDATNCPGWYVFDISAAETNGTMGLFTVKSATATIEVSDIMATFHTAVTASAGVVEAKVMSIDTDVITAAALKADAATEIAAASWNALWTSYTTENSFGRLVRQIFNKVMSLR